MDSEFLFEIALLHLPVEPKKFVKITKLMKVFDFLQNRAFLMFSVETLLACDTSLIHLISGFDTEHPEPSCTSETKKQFYGSQ